MDKNQCPGCGEYFNSSFAFSKHRVGEQGLNRRCLTTSEMISKGMLLNATGFWISQAMPDEAIPTDSSGEEQ